MCRAPARRFLLDGEQFNLEEQRFVRANDGLVRRRAVAVAEVGRNNDAAQAADAHTDDRLAESLNRPVPAGDEVKRSSPDAGSELLPLIVGRRRAVDPTRVIYPRWAARGRLGAGAHTKIGRRVLHVG